MIRIYQVDFVHPGGVRALQDLEFGLERGELAVLAGANGSGKSTLLSLLAGLASPSSGHVQVEGLVLPGQEHELRKQARLVVQDADLQILGATVGEDLLLGREGRGVEARVRSTAARFGLEAYWDRPVQSLSWGQRRKLCLAAALLDAPDLLLLDEPFSGLDYSGILEMRRLLAEHKAAGLTQVLAAHDLDPVADLADRLVVLDAGRLALEGRPEEVLDHLIGHGVRPPCSWLEGRVLRPWESGRD